VLTDATVGHATGLGRRRSVARVGPLDKSLDEPRRHPADLRTPRVEKEVAMAARSMFTAAEFAAIPLPVGIC